MTHFSHVSGDPTLDLVNTVAWRLSAADRQEGIRDYPAVLTWCRESGLLSAEEHHALTLAAREDTAFAGHEHSAVLQLREDLYQALFEDDAVAAHRLADAYRAALVGAELARDDTVWAWRDQPVTLATPRHRIARALVDLLRRPDLDRLHQCEDAKCGWVYLDTSPRRNRRWCIAADCGDRNRARAYYARRTGKA